MALTMVHLLAAELFAQSRPDLKENGDYYLGAISPDAIHVRDGLDKSHKNEVHLNNWLVAHPDEVIDYWHCRHTPFDIGYGVHVLTDCQWVASYRSRFPQLVLKDFKIDVHQYYNDTFITDFELYRARGGERLFALVGQGNAPEDHPKLTRHEFLQWRQDIGSVYLGECPKKEPVKYINRSFVEEFLTACQPLIEQTYARAFPDGGQRL